MNLQNEPCLFGVLIFRNLTLMSTLGVNYLEEREVEIEQPKEFVWLLLKRDSIFRLGVFDGFCMSTYNLIFLEKEKSEKVWAESLHE